MTSNNTSLCQVKGGRTPQKPSVARGNLGKVNKRLSRDATWRVRPAQIFGNALGRFGVLFNDGMHQANLAVASS